MREGGGGGGRKGGNKRTKVIKSMQWGRGGMICKSVTFTLTKVS